MHNYQNTDKIIPEKTPDNPKIYWRRLPIWRFFWYYVQATILDIFFKMFLQNPCKLYRKYAFCGWEFLLSIIIIIIISPREQNSWGMHTYALSPSTSSSSWCFIICVN